MKDLRDIKAEIVLSYLPTPIYLFRGKHWSFTHVYFSSTNVNSDLNIFQMYIYFPIKYI